MNSRRAFLRDSALGLTGAVAANAVWPSALAALSPSPRPPADGAGHFASLQTRPRPTASQLAWQRDELALFVHFGINTYSDREWGDGTESPRNFTPSRLDCRQWARAAKAAGAKAMVLTAKHHDGFCLWPTDTTSHSVRSSLWKNGTGDVVREFVDACRAEGLGVGLYCSPWDRNHKTYGDSPRYNDVYIAQLTELLTRYGKIGEVWFDGANGEGPNGKRQVYDWPRTWALVRKLQPDAVIFSDAGPDVRWIGNERGVAGETNWSTIRPESVPFIGASGDDVIKSLQEGHPDGSVWRPGETDVSIRPGWFYHAAEDSKVKSVEQLVQLYFTSVGRNSKLLLNVPPTRDGLLHETDVANLRGMRAELDTLFSRAPRTKPTWRVESDTVGHLSVDLEFPNSISVIEMREDITQGQRVAKWELLATDRMHVPGEGTLSMTSIARGTTIGYKQLRNIPRTNARLFHLRVETIEPPLPIELRVYR